MTNPWKSSETRAGKDFPVDWYKYLSERSRYRARDGIGMDFGYAEDEIMVVHRPGRFNFRDVEGGFATFSFAWNESGTADSFVTDPKVPARSCSAWACTSTRATCSTRQRRRTTRSRLAIRPPHPHGPRTSNMIAITDSFVDVNNDPGLAAGHLPRHTPGGYFGGRANFAFLDGHVEAQRVTDYTLINDSDSGPGNDWQSETDDPSRKARMPLEQRRQAARRILAQPKDNGQAGTEPRTLRL